MFHQLKMKAKMDQLSNKIIGMLLVVFTSTTFSQTTMPDNNKNVHNPKDYKDPEQFEKFKKRRDVIGAWQINQLKEGALVVRLKTNKALIDALRAQGNNTMALEKEKEQHVINMNTILAYKDMYNFSKLYFIFSNSSDSLLNGTRSGIFLDSNLKVDPSITMNEKFYLLAERDFGYNSSVGFVKEDSARKVSEGGNPVKEMAVLLKNKYGHQLKAPFPYSVKEKNFMDAPYDLPVSVNLTPSGGISIYYTVNRTFLEDIKEKDKGKKITPRTTGNTTAKVKKQFTYEKIAYAVDQLNDNLNRYYRSSPKVEMDKIDATIRPFLY